MTFFNTIKAQPIKFSEVVTKGTPNVPKVILIEELLALHQIFRDEEPENAKQT